MFFFSDGTRATKNIKISNIVSRAGYVLYNQDISEDENWGETIKRKNLKRIYIDRVINKKVFFSVSRIEKKIHYEKDHIIPVNNFIKMIGLIE